jgi:hypothetical protein
MHQLAEYVSLISVVIWQEIYQQVMIPYLAYF